MKELPIELSKRLTQIAQQMAQHEVYGLIQTDAQEMAYEFVSKMCMNNKLVFITDSPVFTNNNKTYECPTFKIPSIEYFNTMLDKKYSEDKEVFCYYNVSTSPTMYNPNSNFAASRSIMMRGAFIAVGDDFELKDIIDRNEQIDKILN